MPSLDTVVATFWSLDLSYVLNRPRWLGLTHSTLRALLVLHFAASLVFFEGWSTTDAITAPGVLMVFLVLAQAAVRYRPALVSYAAGLFISAWVLLHVVTDPSGIGPFQHWRGDEAADRKSTRLNSSH